MLEVKDLSKDFDGFLALSDVNLSVGQSERHAVIGPNGAGKSTLFNAITGYLRPTTGTVRLDGRDITGAAPDALVRGGMGRSFQRVTVFPDLTAFDNVQAALLAHHRRIWDLITPGARLYRAETMALLDAVGLADDARRVAGTMAYGRQKQLELALSLACDPKILLLDEPTAGMSPQETTDILGLILRLQSERGLTLLFTEHDMEFVFAIATRMTVLVGGTPLATGAPEEVRADPEVQRVYLGESHAA